MNKLEKSLLSSWYSKTMTLWQLVLAPLTLIYSAVIFIRRQLYRIGVLQSRSCATPVIVVGNITVGGAGKTPIVVALCEMAKSLGYKPGVVSRGYGGDYDGCVVVNADSNPLTVGDEPVLIARRCHVPVCVSRKRIKAVECLTQNGCNIIISDDGLQHLAMRRDLEIIVVDGFRLFGNKKLLPAGPLREPISRLKSADFILSSSDKTPEFDRYHLSSGFLVNLKTSELADVSKFSGSSVNAIAGIAYPSKFFTLLQSYKFEIKSHEFSDHHIFSSDDLDFNNELPIVMTEKDAVKCIDFANDNMWYLPVTACFNDELKQRLQDAMRGLM